MRGRFIAHVTVLLVIAALLFIANLFLGTVNMSPSDLDDPTASVIFHEIRIPKSLTALFVGASLALCGMLMQTLFRNPLAGPYVLGVSSGAGLFVAISVMLVNSPGLAMNYFFGKGMISLGAITGALLVTVLILFVSKKTRSNVTVLLVGIMLSQIFGALQGIVEFMASPESLKNFVIWGMGSVSGTTISDVFLIAPACLATFMASLFMARPLNAILLNESYARNLGINVNRLRVSVIIATAVLTGMSTAFCGPIAFIGLSVPIACRLLFSTSDQLKQMIYCMLCGAIVLLACDTICQLLSNSFALPLNTVTTIAGSPFVIWLLFKSKLLS